VFTSTSIASDWKLGLDEESIQIYTRDAAESNFKEFKGITKLKTSLNSIVSLLEDADACKQWVYIKWTPLSRQIFIEFKIESCTHCR